MCCSKCSSFISKIILPFSILIIFLFQIYAQYSTLITQRTKIDNIRDGRNTMTNYQLSKDKEYDFNMNKVQEYFEDNCLMKINFLKNTTLHILDSILNKKGEIVDNRIYMFYYLIIYDIICVIIVYIFIYGSIKAGFIKITFQIIRFYFNAQRMKKFNSNLDLYSIIKSKIENMYIFRGWNIFSPEGFLIIEFLCNFEIILDIIYLILLICNKKRNKTNKKIYKLKEELVEITNNEDINDENSIDENKENNNETNNINDKDSKVEESSIGNKKEKNNNNTEGTLNIFENEDDEEDDKDDKECKDVEISDESSKNN